MRVILPAGALVVRFAPIRPEKLLQSADLEFRTTGLYSLSVFAAAPDDGESREHLLGRVIQAAGLSINLESNKKVWVCVEAKTLGDRGFTLHRYDDPEEPEPEMHYSVDLGSAPTMERAQEFVECFDEGRTRDHRLH